MRTPILDFIKGYAQDDKLRLHMPGHKGEGSLIARYDITEIDGADSLYSADGIIRESEENASALFGAHTFYSAEGSSLSIRAMLYLVCLYARQSDRRAKILAGRNAHKSFISSAILLDFEIDWLTPDNGESYLTCTPSAKTVKKRFDEADGLPTALYLTSPDYLGFTSDIEGIAKVCRDYGVILLVDNAHGAYLKFLPESRHPIDLGADMCADSAHKTLPTLTGGAYLHVSKTSPSLFKDRAKDALALFGSTSPSYLILASLDETNAYLDNGYTEKLNSFIYTIKDFKKSLTDIGYTLVGDEPMKITIASKSYGYLGTELAAMIGSCGIVHEFADPDHLVLMPTPETGEAGLSRLKKALETIPRRHAVKASAPWLSLPERVMTPREASLAECETLPSSACLGRVLASVTVGCPPAVPIAVSGERIDERAIQAFKYYGIDTLRVII